MLNWTGRHHLLLFASLGNARTELRSSGLRRTVGVHCGREIKLRLEEHIAVEETEQESLDFMPQVVWSELRNRLDGYQESRLRLMDASDVTVKNRPATFGAGQYYTLQQ